LVVDGVVDRLLQALNDVRRCGKIRITDPQADDVNASGRHFGFFLVDLGKKIGRERS
jgi:hypothetical protein